ncbi:GH92 family glycosyl hydrolase [Maribacter sp.]|uniref:GH92 family glycosyl hydrolase n=1 Tax=Maribacter sp. TaxID=1897614 RepID=UPI0025B8C1B5|nr:GH92 family glycosyl hydrolase [Maribacter sp.]
MKVWIKKYSGFLIFLLLFVGCNELEVKEHKTNQRLTQYVNPFIGTDGPGNTYPGATVPFGMVQLSPDIGIPGWDRIAGYYYQDSIITGFSHLHLTGTGAGDLCDILVMPTNSKSSKRIKENNFKPFSKFDHKQETAFPGYYSVNLLDYDITAEMTATKHVGVHRYTFPKDKKSSIHVDLGYAINWDKPTGWFIDVVNDSTLQGYRMSTGWARNQKVYFEMQFSKPFESYEINEVDKSKIVLQYNIKQEEAITVKTGLSSVSSKAAGKAIVIEADSSFDTIKTTAENAWERELQKVEITSDNQNKKTIFYTMMYQSMLAPTLYGDINGDYKAANDANGKYKKGKDTIATAIDFVRYDTFSLWDTFRAAHPLYTILHQEKIPDIVKSLLAHYKETDILPVWSMQGSETNMMMGYHAVPVIVDAYFKGFKFNVNLAYEACKASAMVRGRKIGVYQELGYVPVDEEHENWSVSKTMEYAYDDWCIAMFAKDLGKEKDYHYFLKRSESWKNLYNTKNSWLQPKHTSGAFVTPFVPKEYSPYYCESNAWQYYWFVPQDINGLISKTGGKDRFEQKLDSMFSYFPEPEDKLPLFSTGMIGQYAHGNEPSHHVAYLYNHINKPAKTQKLIRQILEEQYKNEPNGHCGNEDCGQMSSWYIFNSLGFYPVNPAQGVYDLGIPLFKEAKIKVNGDKFFSIKTENFGNENNVVKQVSLNGEVLQRAFITHKEIMNGGVLIFTMTSDIEQANENPLQAAEVNKIY